MKDDIYDTEKVVVNAITNYSWRLVKVKEISRILLLQGQTLHEC